jgi:hypothetical protein
MHTLGHVLWELLDWPSGIVVGNLIASAIWQPWIFRSLHQKMNTHHDEVKDLLDPDKPGGLTRELIREIVGKENEK